MTPTLEAMAREAGAWPADILPNSGADQSLAGRARTEALARFAALVRAQALEDAARVLDMDWPADAAEERAHRASCAAAIRALPTSAG